MPHRVQVFNASPLNLLCTRDVACTGLASPQIALYPLLQA
jgi:hypothetical protein